MRYPGGKGASGVVQTIINQQPPHDVYVEPFLGGGAVMRAKRPARRNVGMDLDASSIAAFGDGRRGFALAVGDGFTLLRRFVHECPPRCLIYVDPPYLGSVRKSLRPIYRHEMQLERPHRLLLETLCELTCLVQVSGYWSSLYASMLQGWRVVRFPSMTRRGVAEECLWMNYPEPLALHDYRFLGATFRERERIKRKVSRWTKRLEKLPPLERLGIYSAMSAALDGSGDGARRSSPEVARQAIARARIVTPGDGPGRIAKSGGVGSRRIPSSDLTVSDRT